jgi:putative transposase
MPTSQPRIAETTMIQTIETWPEHTPASVHHGTADEIRVQRGATLDAAYAANPTRFRHRRPAPPKPPTAAWINEPTREALIQNE